MKKTLFIIALFATIAQAQDVVHYDQNEKPDKNISKPNHPNNDIHVIR
ncbi:MAG: hypothetical protein PF439_12800 [Helicobacteraceae bacterium]|jgi:hypothetical protein|nr:hypothetical protein [Helicobacteraceae bacterium]